jgi:hypothetical protein
MPGLGRNGPLKENPARSAAPYRQVPPRGIIPVVEHVCLAAPTASWHGPVASCRAGQYTPTLMARQSGARHGRRCLGVGHGSEAALA